MENAQEEIRVSNVTCCIEDTDVSCKFYRAFLPVRKWKNGDNLGPIIYYRHTYVKMINGCSIIKS